MVFEVSSTRSLSEIDARLKESAARHKFGVLTVHDLKAKMKEKGVEFAKECLIYEVCNPQQAKIVLEANPAISTALPCRISVIGEPGSYRIQTLRPTKLMTIFDTPENVLAVAQEVEDVVLAMIRESA